MGVWCQEELYTGLHSAAMTAPQTNATSIRALQTQQCWILKCKSVHQEGRKLVGPIAVVDGIQELAHYWEKEYDWRKAEAHINSFANYEMEVNGIEVGCPCQSSPARLHGLT